MKAKLKYRTYKKFFPNRYASVYLQQEGSGYISELIKGKTIKFIDREAIGQYIYDLGYLDLFGKKFSVIDGNTGIVLDILTGQQVQVQFRRGYRFVIL